jgi:hypothetical protein
MRMTAQKNHRSLIGPQVYGGFIQIMFGGVSGEDLK